MIKRNKYDNLWRNKLRRVGIRAEKAASQVSLIFAAYTVAVCKAIETNNQFNITYI